MKRLAILLLCLGAVGAVAQGQVPPPADICTGNYFYQETCNGGWNAGWPGTGPAGFVYQGCADHAKSVYGETGRRFNIVGQGANGSIFAKPPDSDPSAQALWVDCYVNHNTSGGYSRCSTSGAPGVQNPILRPLSQVTDAAKKASWKIQFGCNATPTPSPVPTPTASPYADWIEQLWKDGISSGCGGGNFCPKSTITREQLAVWLVKAMHGPSFVPPHCVGVFNDVGCAP